MTFVYSGDDFGQFCLCNNLTMLFLQLFAKKFDFNFC